MQAEKGEPHYMAKIIEFFQAKDGEPYFRAQWFFRPEDTVRSCYFGFEYNVIYCINLEFAF